MTAVLAAAVIASVVLGVLAGSRADSQGLFQQRSERSWRTAIATLQQNAAQSATGIYGSDIAWVTARWQLPDGQHRSGQVAAELNARAGQKVTIWVNFAGPETGPPLTSADVRGQVISIILSVVLAIAIVAGIAAGGIRLLCHRHRMAGWQQAWDAIGPTWSWYG
jgi:hypothetical protein